MSHKTTVLVVGGNGMLGHKVVKELAKDPTLSVMATASDKPKFDFPNVKWITNYKISKESIHDVVTKMTPECDFIINCAGLIHQRFTAQSDITEYYVMNSLLPKLLADKASNRFIHISSDCVFTGSSYLGYEESDVPDATDHYGLSKFLGEDPAKSIVLRTSIIGTELPTQTVKSGLLEWVRMQADLNVDYINGYVNHYWNGVTTMTLAKIIHQIITKDYGKCGLYHILTPDDALSKYDLVKLIAEAFGLNVRVNKFATEQFVSRELVTRKKFYNSIRHLIPSMAEQLKELAKEE